MSRIFAGFIHWHVIHWAGSEDLPERGKSVLVYDGDLNDIIEGHCLDIDGNMVLCDTLTGQRLPDPYCWAEKPFP